MSAGEKVHVVNGKAPSDYHCKCDYCKTYIGELKQPDGSYYSRLERRHYYSPDEKGKGGHIAKTPLHIARWAIQQYSSPGDWVLDPTIGAGTTAVEAITQNRNVAGMELEFGHIVEANVAEAMKLNNQSVEFKFAVGDAREIGTFLKSTDPNKKKRRFQLVVNNPPYFGDISMPSPKGKLRGKEHRHLETRFDYDKTLPNLAFLKEGAEYWETMGKIYSTCADRLVDGGHFVIGVKDQMRNKQPDNLHGKLNDLLRDVVGLKFVGTALLKHHPGTLHLNTYEKRYGVPCPTYQTISVFQKGG